MYGYILKSDLLHSSTLSQALSDSIIMLREHGLHSTSKMFTCRVKVMLVSMPSFLLLIALNLAFCTVFMASGHTVTTVKLGFIEQPYWKITNPVLYSSCGLFNTC